MEPSYEPNASEDSETLVLIGVIAVLGLAVLGWILLDIPGYWSGKTDLLGNHRVEHYVETRDREPASYRRIHAELFPMWLVHSGQSSDAWRSDRAIGAFEKFRNRIPDEELKGVADEVWQFVASREFRGRQSELTALANEWNRRLTKLDEPYFVRLGMSSRGGLAFVWGGFYLRLAEPAIRVGESEYRTPLLLRVDNTNLREMYLGGSQHNAEYAFVIADRVRDFTREGLLPVVAAGKGGRSGLDPIPRAFADRVRSALRQGIGEERYADLEQMARLRKPLAAAVESIRERQKRCDGDFRITGPPWNGYNDRTLQSLVRYARRDGSSECASVRPREAKVIGEASEQLRSGSFRAAYEAAVAWAARGTAIHEVRHRVDQEDIDTRTEGPACKGCSETVHPRVRAELSAYAASVAWSETPSIPLFQACRVDSKSVHGRAVEILVDELDDSCVTPPPENLGERARKVESRLFEHATEMKIPEDFPDRLELRSSEKR